MASTQSQDTRSYLENLFGHIQTSSFSSAFQTALSDDLIWTVTGSSPFTGVYKSKQAYLDGVLNPLLAKLDTPIHPKIQRMIVEAEWAAVYFESENVRAKNGADFSMQYVWLIKVQAAKVVEVVGFYDQKKMADVFA